MKFWAKLSVLLLSLAITACAGGIDEQGPNHVDVPGLAKSDLQLGEWTLSHTITFAPDDFGELFGVSTPLEVVSWDITEDFLVATQMVDTPADGMGSFGFAVAAYPITAHVGAQGRVDVGTDAPSPGTSWYELDHVEVEWRNVVAAQDRFDSGLFESLAWLDSDGALDESMSLRYADGEALGDGPLIEILFEEVIRMEPTDPTCEIYPDGYGCDEFTVVLRTHFARITD